MLSIITGIFGMDAQNMASILLDKGHKVVGTYRYSSVPLDDRLKTKPAFYQRLSLVCSDLTDASGTSRLIADYQPDYIFNLAAMSHVGASFNDPAATFNADTIGVLNLLEGIKLNSPHTRLYQAATSEMFGKNYDVKDGVPTQSIHTPFLPSSPYGVAKLASHHLINIYRAGYGVHAVSGILFNHTDIHRTPTFFERKVSIYAGKLARWKEANFVKDLTDLTFSNKFVCSKISGSTFPKLPLGTIEGVHRDIGWSYDYMRAALLMVEADDPKDYVVSSGEAYPLTDILKVIPDYSHFIYIDPEFVRPVDVPYLRGDSTPIREELGWSPTKSFHELIEMLVAHDSR